MSFPYSQSFPGALTLGVNAPGWVNAKSGVFTVQAGGFGEVSPVIAHACVYTGGGTLTDQEITFTQITYVLNSAPYMSAFDCYLRTNAGATTGIYLQLNYLNKTVAAYDVGAGFTQIGAFLQIQGPPTGTSSTMTCSIKGNRIGFTFNGMYYCPQDWICPSGYTSGYCGVGYDISHSPPGNAIFSQITIDGNPASVPLTQLTEIATPVPIIGPSGTYDGHTAAGTSPFNWIYDAVTSLWVCPIALSNAPSDVYGYFLTSPDLVTFTNVSGSLMTPQGSDTIIENIACLRIPNTVAYGANANKYLLTGFHYNTTGSPINASLWISTTLTGFQAAGPIDNFLPLGSVGSGDHDQIADPAGILNPVNGNIELWYSGVNNSFSTQLHRSIMMADTPDLVTWTKHGIFLTGDVYDGQGGDIGAPSVNYGVGPDGSANARWLCYDGGSIDGLRIDWIAWAKQTSPGVWGAFTKLGPCNYARIAHTYESVTVFGACIVGNLDRGDGNGPQFYVVYNGQNSAVTSVLVNGAIGLGFFPPYNPIFSKTTGVASMTGVQSIAL